MTQFNTNFLVKMVISLMETDKSAYQENLDAIANDTEYFTKNDFYELKYWVAWFGGSDMKEF